MIREQLQAITKRDIRAIIEDGDVCDNLTQATALADIIMRQITEVPLTLLTESRIRNIIEQEIHVNMKVKEDMAKDNGFFN